MKTTVTRNQCLLDKVKDLMTNTNENNLTGFINSLLTSTLDVLHEKIENTSFDIVESFFDDMFADYSSESDNSLNNKAPNFPITFNAQNYYYITKFTDLWKKDNRDVDHSKVFYILLSIAYYYNMDMEKINSKFYDPMLYYTIKYKPKKNNFSFAETSYLFSINPIHISFFNWLKTYNKSHYTFVLLDDLSLEFRNSFVKTEYKKDMTVKIPFIFSVMGNKKTMQCKKQLLI